LHLTQECAGVSPGWGGGSHVTEGASSTWTDRRWRGPYLPWEPGAVVRQPEEPLRSSPPSVLLLGLV
jgi:hypothetical protein